MVPPSLAKSPLLCCSPFAESPSKVYLPAVYTSHCLSLPPIYPFFSGCSYKIILALHHKSKQSFLSSHLYDFFVSANFSSKKRHQNPAYAYYTLKPQARAKNHQSGGTNMCNGGFGGSNCWWIIILLLCCGGCGNGNNSGFDNCLWPIILLLCCCNNGSQENSSCGCGC